MLPPVHLSASASLQNSWFSACSFLFYLRPFYETLIHWQGNKLSLIFTVASNHELFPLVKRLALNQEHKNSDKIL